LRSEKKKKRKKTKRKKKEIAAYFLPGASLERMNQAMRTAITKPEEAKQLYSAACPVKGAFQKLKSKTKQTTEITR
jgi:hypothetical protein